MGRKAGKAISEQMKISKNRKITFICAIMLLVLHVAASAAWARESDHIKFDPIFETGGYNFDITQDKDGFIWVGTINGVRVYNGYEVKSYSAGPDTFPSNNIRTVFVDSDGLVWLSTFGGLVMYDKSTDAFTTYLDEPDNPDSISSSTFKDSPNLIAEGKDGLLWFGTANGLNSFDKKTGLFTRYMHDPNDKNSLSDNEILSVFVDKDGFVWIGTKGKVLDKFDTKTGKFTHYRHNPESSQSIGPGEVTVVTEDADGFLWIGTSEGGLTKFDKNTETFTHYQHDPNDPDSLANNDVRVIVPDRYGYLWLCHPWWVDVGIERFDKAKGTFTQYKHDPENPETTISDRVQVVFEDNSGTLWVGENQSTVSTYDRQARKFHLYRSKPNDSGSVIGNVTCIMEDSNRDIWLGSGTDGLAKYNREKDNFTVYPADPAHPDDNNVTSMYEDSSNNFWITTNNGMLGLFNRETGKFIKRYYHPGLVQAWDMMEDPRNADLLWLATFNNGISKFHKKTETFTDYKSDDHGKPFSHLLGVFRDDQDVLWFISETNGLIRHNRKTDNFTTYQHVVDDPESVSSNNLNFFYISKKGAIWISAQNGLNRFDKDSGTFKPYGKKDGFTSNVRGILEDHKGYLWIGSDSGLLKFDPEAGKVLRVYGEGGSKFNFSPQSILKTDEGEMWFSTNLGVIRFNPDKVRDNPYIPPVYLSSITQGGNKLTRMAPEKIAEIELSGPNNFFEFEYVALNYTRSNKNQYAYMLKGFDRGWYRAGEKRFGRYTGIPPGVYTLRIKGSNNDSVWNEDGASIRVTVLPQLWQTWWFKGMMVVIVLISVLAMIIWRFTLIKSQRQHLEIQVGERTKDLREEIEVRKKADEALGKSESRFREMFEQSPFGIALIGSLTGDIYELNPKFGEICGRTFEEMINTDWMSITHPEDVQEDLDNMALLNAGRIPGFNMDKRYIRPDGSPVWINMTIAPLSVEDATQPRHLCMIEDITEQKEAAKEREELQEQLQQAQKMEAIGTLAGGVAHDLNNILGGLVSYPELLLLQLPEDSPLRKSILTIQKSGEKAAAVVQDLLTLARRGVVVAEVVNPHEIISEYLESPEHENLQSFHPTVHIETHIEKDTLNILGSPTHLSKTVMNLISNAAESMPEGGKLTVSTENRYIDRPIRGYDNVKEGDYVVFTISDTGTGISPDDIAKIFEPFYSKKKMGRSGTGLGMAVVWGTVKDHNGYIDVQSTEGKGSTFTLYFPATREKLPEDKPHLAIGSYSGDGESILVIDDVEEQRKIASGMLKELGYSVVSVSSGEEAVEYLSTNKVHLLVLDMVMEPGMDGLDTYKKIIEMHPDQKAIIASGFSETGRAKEVQGMGAGAYIRKPFLLEKIGIAIKKELEK